MLGCQLELGETFASMGRFQFLGSSLTNGGVPPPPFWPLTSPGNGKKLFYDAFLEREKTTNVLPNISQVINLPRRLCCSSVGP